MSTDDATSGRVARVARRIKVEILVPGRASVRNFSGALLAIVAVGSGTAAAASELSGLPSGAAFRIGDSTTWEKQLDHRVQVLGVLYGVQPPDQPDQLDKFTRDTAKAVATSEVMEKAAAEQGIIIPDKVATDQVNNLAEQAGPDGKRTFITKLGQLGISEDDVIADVKRQMANSQLYDAVTKDVKPVTEDELRKTFDARRAQMVTPEQRHLRNIVLPTEDAARNVAQRARAGEDFGLLASENSADSSTKANGGDLGQVMAAQLEQPYSDAAFSAPPNSVFGPMQTKNGWNVGQVLDVTPGQPLNYDQIRDQFRSQVDGERKAPVWDQWLGEKISAADVEYANKYRPANPSAPPKLGQ